MNPDSDSQMTAAQRWRDELQRWAIPEHILHAAPEDPHAFSVDRFTALATDALRQPPTPTHNRARERLADGGSVLDVGCGGGAGSLPLAPPARRLVGVDQSAGMLAAYTTAATARGATVTTVEGRWPDIAGAVPVADVVVCAHVIYNVTDLAPCAEALTTHAARRVVLEFPTRHPLAWLTPYWQALHGLDRPAGPSADDAQEVFAGLGVRPRRDGWRRTVSLHAMPVDKQVGFIRARLALGVERADDVREQIDRLGVPAERDVVTTWWDV